MWNAETPARPRASTTPKAPNWVLLVVLIFVAPIVWTVAPVLTFIFLAITVVLPLLAFLTVPFAGLVGSMVAAWTALMIRETMLAKAYLKAKAR